MRHVCQARVIRVRVRRFCDARRCGCGLPPQVGVVVSSCHYVAAGRSPSRSLARGGGEGGASRSARAQCAVIRTDGQMMGVQCLARVRVVREDEREDKNKKMRGRHGGASAGGAELTSARA